MIIVSHKSNEYLIYGSIVGSDHNCSQFCHFIVDNFHCFIKYIGLQYKIKWLPEWSA